MPKEIAAFEAKRRAEHQAEVATAVEGSSKAQASSTAG
jgi:hypothetical protein